MNRNFLLGFGLGPQPTNCAWALYLNTPGQFDGEARFWIDGVLQSRVTKMSYRDIETLLPTDVHLNLHRTTADFPQTMVRWTDNIIIAPRYIGPVLKE